MWEYGLGASVGALLELGEDLDWSNDHGLRGTVFPISESERLYIGAKHTIPVSPSQSGIMIRNKGETVIKTVVEEVREIPGRPDVVVIKARDGVLGIGGISTEAPRGVWTEVASAGYPEDAIDARPEVRLVSVRGLKGYITRPLPVGEAHGFPGDSYELSFAIPAGMSGSPLVNPKDIGLMGGVVGVCVGSHEARTTEWELEIDDVGASRRNYRVVEYGVASVLLSDDIDPFTGKPLIEVMGWGAGGAKEYKGPPM